MTTRIRPEQIRNLDSGGGVSALGLAQIPSGLIHFTTAGVPLGSGLFGGFYTSSGSRGMNNYYGLYCQIKPATGSGTMADIRSTKTMSYIHAPILVVKFNFINTTSSYECSIGLHPAFYGGLNAGNYPQIGLYVNRSLSNGQVNFRTRDVYGQENTLTSYTLRHSTDPYYLIIEYKSTTEVKFSLYDKDMTLLTDATHTTHILAEDLAMGFLMENKSSTTDPGFKLWYIKALHSIA